MKRRARLMHSFREIFERRPEFTPNFFGDSGIIRLYADSDFRRLPIVPFTSIGDESMATLIGGIALRYDGVMRD